MKKLSCKQARQIDLVEYLASLGHRPKSVRNNSYLYLSPLREEKTPSFKVDRSRQLWYDFGVGQGGDIIDFGVHYFSCSVSDLLEQLSTFLSTSNVSFHPQTPGSTRHDLISAYQAGEKKESDSGKILIIGERPLTAISLIQYMQTRCITLEIALSFCREVDFELYGKRHIAIGFKNEKGGFELRSQHFKGGSSPKAITLIEQSSSELTVFEGFFDFLSFLVLQSGSTTTSSFLILNSNAFFFQNKELMDKYQLVNLFLDRDKTGIKCTRQALGWNNKKYVDKGEFLQPDQDLNDWLIQKSNPALYKLLSQKQTDYPRKSRGL